MKQPFLLAVLMVTAGTAAAALTLEFPAPAQGTADLTEPLASYRLPTGAFAGGAIPARVIEGAVKTQAWRIDAPGTPTLAMMQALRAQLDADGYAILFECETEACGGFDFRFGIGVLPEPDMHVDLGDFRFLSAARGQEAVALLVSRSASAGFVQMVEVRPSEGGSDTLFAATPAEGTILPAPALTTGDGPSTTLSAAGAPPPGISVALARDGVAQLPDLEFPTGGTALADSPYPSLAALSEWLKANPSTTVALVGHTDASGGLAANIQVSRARAQSVRERLVSRYGVPGTQVAAEGVGYLAPRAGNATEEGRQANRRVEVVVTSTP